MKIGNNLKSLREKANLTQEDFAAKSGVPRPSISLIEQSKRKISITEFVKFCEILDCSYEELIGKQQKESEDESAQEDIKGLYDFYKKNYKVVKGSEKRKINPLDEHLEQVNPYYYPVTNEEIRYER